MSETKPPQIENADSPQVIGYAGPTTNMPPTFAVVWCRILALWMFAWGLYSGTYFVGLCLYFLLRAGAPSDPQMLPALLDETLPAAVWLVMAWYCWRKAPVLALRMTQDADPNPSARGMTADELLHILLMGIGIYLLSTGLPTIVQLAYTMFDTMRKGLPMFSSSPVISPSELSSIVRCLLGFWFIFGTHGLVILLRRHGGKWRDNSETGKRE